MAETITLEYLQEELDQVSYTLDKDSSDKILSKLNHLLKMYAMETEAMINEMLAFLMNKKLKRLTLELLESFDEDCLDKKLISKPKSTPGRMSRLRASMLEAVGVPVADVDMMGMYGNGGDSPLNDRVLGTPSSRFGTPSSSNPVKPELRKIIPASSLTGKFFRPSETRRATAAQVELLNGKHVKGMYGNEKLVDIIQTDIEDVGYFPQRTEDEENFATDCVVGYVFKEAGGEGGITDKNACIRTYNSIKRLGFERVQDVTIYPGQRIKVYGGENTTGDTFHVDPNGIAPRTILPLADLKFPEKEKPSTLTVMAAAGPYMSTAEHNFADLYQLVDEAVTTADVLILSGPFLFRQNSFYTSPNCPATVHELFVTFLLEINEKVKKSPLKVIIIPDCQKDFSVMPFYPTPAFSIDDSLARKLSSNIHLYPDPAVFNIDGVRFAVCNSEVIAKLCACEFHRSKNSENEDRMRRQYSHLFYAHSLYPLMQSEHDKLAINMKSQKGFEISEAPHVLIAPSKVGPHTKMVLGSVCVNPSTFWRSNQRTHAKIQIDLATLAGQGKTENQTIRNHAKIEMVRDSTKSD